MYLQLRIESIPAFDLGWILLSFTITVSNPEQPKLESLVCNTYAPGKLTNGFKESLLKELIPGPVQKKYLPFAYASVRMGCNRTMLLRHVISLSSPACGSGENLTSIEI